MTGYPDHGREQDLEAVILSADAPSDFMVGILHDPELSERVTYIQGSPFNERDLERSSMDTASACFLLTNKFSPKPEEQDANTILTAMALKRCVWIARSWLLWHQARTTPHTAVAPRPARRFVMNKVQRRLRLCIQLIRPENANHFRHMTIGPNTELEHRDQIVCVERLKMKLLAKVLPGRCTVARAWVID